MLHSITTRIADLEMYDGSAPLKIDFGKEA
jgi:hypothetical protein